MEFVRGCLFGRKKEQRHVRRLGEMSSVALERAAIAGQDLWGNLVAVARTAGGSSAVVFAGYMYNESPIPLLNHHFINVLSSKSDQRTVATLH
jgi:hypothetical protein